MKSSASIRSDTAGKPIKRRSTQEDSAFNSFKRLCEAHGLLKRPVGLASMMELMESMMRLPFCTCLVPSFRIIPGFTVLIRVPDGSSMPNNASLRSPPTVQGGSPLAREVNRLCSFYERIDVHAYEETRSLVSSPAHPDSTRTEHFTQYPYWVGRRDKRGQPICMFDAAKLGSKTMAAFK